MSDVHFSGKVFNLKRYFAYHHNSPQMILRDIRSNAHLTHAQIASIKNEIVRRGRIGRKLSMIERTKAEVVACAAGGGRAWLGTLTFRNDPALLVDEIARIDEPDPVKARKLRGQAGERFVRQEASKFFKRLRTTEMVDRINARHAMQNKSARERAARLGRYYDDARDKPILRYDEVVFRYQFQEEYGERNRRLHGHAVICTSKWVLKEDLEYMWSVSGINETMDADGNKIRRRSKKQLIGWCRFGVVKDALYAAHYLAKYTNKASGNFRTMCSQNPQWGYVDTEHSMRDKSVHYQRWIDNKRRDERYNVCPSPVVDPVTYRATRRALSATRRQFWQSPEGQERARVLRKLRPVKPTKPEAVIVVGSSKSLDYYEVKSRFERVSAEKPQYKQPRKLKEPEVKLGRYIEVMSTRGRPISDQLVNQLHRLGIAPPNGASSDFETVHEGSELEEAPF